jgi:two-component system phosphate regulon sensor histidine kinase PhoR
VAELRRPAAERRKQSLETGVRAPLPPVLGDPDYLERALANLVDNAVKYTPEGGTLRLSAFARGDSVVLEVADTGIGIPETDLPRIFERFYRVDKSRSREMGGTGLGLAIVKHVVQAHGGSVEVTSRVGQGSTFRIVLPAARGA